MVHDIDAPYKHWIIYNVDVKTFHEGNRDGDKDFPGLRSRLNYIISFELKTIWLEPFQPSALQDDSYDAIGYPDSDSKTSRLKITSGTTK